MKLWSILVLQQIGIYTSIYNLLNQVLPRQENKQNMMYSKTKKTKQTNTPENHTSKLGWFLGGNFHILGPPDLHYNLSSGLWHHQIQWFQIDMIYPNNTKQIWGLRVSIFGGDNTVQTIFC